MGLAMQPEFYDCFLSYRNTDLEAAQTIHKRLTEAGLRIWFDKSYLKAGMRWHEEIEKHCEASRILIPLLTPDWKKSQWTRYETYGAENVIPLILRGDWQEVSTPPLALYQNHALDLAKATNKDWERLIKRIREYCDQPRLERNAQDRLTLLKHRPIDHFVGRDQTLVELHEKLFLDRLTALTHGSVIAIPALGGVGKTTLARHYAEKFWRCYRQMFWIDCRQGIEAGFAEIFDLMQPDIERTIPMDVRAKRAKQALEQIGPGNRLLILDNAEDEQSIQPWIPATGNCHVLITSRFAGWSKGIATHPVWVLEPEPAKELLLKRSGLKEDPAASKVADKLQYLPLALEQAAAYVGKQTGFGFADYLRLYEANEKTFLDRKTPGATNYPDSVYLTWRTTRDRLPEGAKAMLRLHAFYASTPFPVGLYIKGALKFAEEMGDSVVPDEVMIRDWKDALVEYSMAKSEPNDCVSVHALVQAVERHEMGANSAKVAERSAQLYWSATPEPSWNQESRNLWSILASHSRALGDCELVDGALRGRIYSDLAAVFRYEGDYAEGAEAARRALEVNERVLGLEHPDTISSVNKLAFLLQNKGDYDRAEILYRRAFEADERVLGPEHPNTLATVSNLALLLQTRGDYENAEPLCRRALEASERVLGPEHANTTSVVNNLALLLHRKGDYENAEPLYRRALEARERVLGAEHPDTLTMVNNLAGLLDNKGDHENAEPLYRRTLEIRERALGPEHPDTLTSAYCLALLLHSKGDYEDAEPLYRSALNGFAKVLGLNHPITCACAENCQNLLTRLKK